MGTAVMELKEVETSDEVSTSRPRRIDVASRIGFTNQILLMVASPLLDRRGGQVEVFDPISSRRELETLAKAVERLRVAFDLAIHFVISGRPVVRDRDRDQDRPLFLHVAAHGMVAGHNTLLAAESPTGERQFLDTRAVGTLLKPFGQPPCALAVLNVCHSEGLATRLVRLGVPHVVGIEAGEKSLARAGQVFAEHFYYGVLTGNSVQAAFDLARQAVQDDSEITRLGRGLEEYLKIRLFPEDVPHTETLAAEDFPGEPEFPPWEDTNLEEYPRYPVIGRQIDLFELNSMIRAAASHLFLVTGMGGMGKTALAEALGRWQHERSWWPRGVWKIEARDIYTANEVRGMLAARLRLPGTAAETDGALAKALRPWSGLLILDDLDRLSRNDRTGLEGLLAALLGGCPRLRIVVTLRHTQEFPQPGLYGTHEVRPLGRDHVLECFQNYLQEPMWTESESTYQTDLNDLVSFLDGHPLAIKLAASHMRQQRVGLHTLWQRLVDRPLDTLRYKGVGEDRDTSLRVSLEVSLDAMPPSDRDFYPLLACFPSGMTEGVAQGAFGPWAVQRLEDIHSYSMVEIESDRYLEVVERRFRLPEPARHFARWQLDQLQLLDKYGKQVARFYAQFIDKHGGGLRDSASAQRYAEAALETLRKSKLRSNEDIENLEQERDGAAAAYARARNILWSEHANLLVWLPWALEQPSREVLLDGCRTLAGLTYFWGRESPEGPRHVTEFFAKAEKAAGRHPEALGVVQEARGDFSLLLGQAAPGQEDFGQALQSYQKAGRSSAVARVHEKLSGGTDGATSIEHLDKARRIYESLKDSEGLGVARCSEELAVRRLRLGESAEARKELERAVQEYDKVQEILRAYRRYASQAAESGHPAEAVHAFMGAIQEAADSAYFPGMADDVTNLCGLLRRKKPPKKVAEVLRRAQAVAENANRDDIARFVGAELARL